MHCTDYRSAPKLTVELLFSITKRLPGRDPPGFLADHVKLFIRLRCVAIPTYLRLTVSYSYLEITVLVMFFRLGSFEIGDALPLRSRNVQMGSLGHYLSTRFSCVVVYRLYVIYFVQYVNKYIQGFV